MQRGAYFGRCLPTGQLIYIRQGTLFGAPFDLEKLEVTGTPLPLVENVNANVSFGGGQLDFSKNGTLVYLSGKSSDDLWHVVWMDSSGKSQPIIPTAGRFIWPRLSPDGKRIALEQGFETAQANIWIYDLERQTPTKLTFTGADRMAIWTPDGKHLAYASAAEGIWTIQWIRADGAGQPQRIFESKMSLAPRLVLRRMAAGSRFYPGQPGQRRQC